MSASNKAQTMHRIYRSYAATCWFMLGLSVAGLISNLAHKRDLHISTVAVCIWVALILWPVRRLKQAAQQPTTEGGR